MEWLQFQLVRICRHDSAVGALQTLIHLFFPLRRQQTLNSDIFDLDITTTLDHSVGLLFDLHDIDGYLCQIRLDWSFSLVVELCTNAVEEIFLRVCRPPLNTIFSESFPLAGIAVRNDGHTRHLRMCRLGVLVGDRRGQGNAAVFALNGHRCVVSHEDNEKEECSRAAHY